MVEIFVYFFTFHENDSQREGGGGFGLHHTAGPLACMVWTELELLPPCVIGISLHGAVEMYSMTLVPWGPVSRRITAKNAASVVTVDSPAAVLLLSLSLLLLLPPLATN